jgi:sulfite exporter TauE/SafE
MAVVGGLVLAISSKWNARQHDQTFSQKMVPHLRFNIGRIVGFGVLGGVLGLFGSVVQLSPFMMAVMMLIVGGVMFLLGVNLTHISPKLSSLSLSLPTGTLFAKKEADLLQSPSREFSSLHPLQGWLKTVGSGVLTFFIPCGFTFAMQLYAINTGSFRKGMAVMALFALGTLPGLIGVGSLTSIFKGKTAQIAYKVIGVLVMLLGLYNISNSYGVVATKF